MAPLLYSFLHAPHYHLYHHIAFLFHFFVTMRASQAFHLMAIEYWLHLSHIFRYAGFDIHFAGHISDATDATAIPRPLAKNTSSHIYATQHLE